MASFTFLHAADIHLDSPLRGLAGQEGAAAERIRSATRQAFINLVDLALEEEVAFLLIAGDLYDGDWKDYQTGLFFVGQMGRLSAAGIPVFLLYGNHDAESQITRRLTLPPGVHAFSARKAETVTLQDLGVALHGWSFPQREVTQNLVPDYPAPLPGLLNIGLLHTGLGGLGGHANYAPCSQAELAAKGYAYWALGHVHRGQVLQQDPWIVFPGNLQGRHIRETGAKGACLVRVEEEAIAEVAWRSLDVVRWAEVSVPFEGVDQMEDVPGRILAGLNAALPAAEGRLLASRVILTGRTALHAQLHQQAEALGAEARAAALGLGAEVAWIEKLVIDTRPLLTAEEIAARNDALAKLQALLAEAIDDPDLRDDLHSQLQPLLGQTPLAVEAEEGGFLATARAGDYDALLEAARRLLIDELALAEGLDAP
ncbi:MAG: DNA repair exonuclease [Pseudomonadota bacterium]